MMVVPKITLLSFQTTHSLSLSPFLQEDLPDMGEEDGLLVTPRKHRSYSPRREEKARLLEEEVLPDTVSISFQGNSINLLCLYNIYSY